MKDKKKNFIYLIVLIVVIIIAVAGATYAYFVSSININNALVNLATTTGSSSAFTAYTEGNIAFNISFSQMTQDNISKEFIATDNATGIAKIDSGNSAYTTTCSYDLVWVWDSEDRYMMSDVDLPYTSEDGSLYPYEFSVKVDEEVEKDLSSLDWSPEGKAIISHKELKSENGQEAVDDFYIQVNMYNIPIVQNNLFNKTFGAHIAVENNTCVTTQAGVKLNYYIYNTSTGKYEKSSSVPIGDYRINTNKTTCQNGGTVKSYDNIAGSLEMDLMDNDVCDIYFSIIDRVSASGSNITSNFDGNLKYITVEVNNKEDATIYYSIEEELTPTNYSLRGSTTNPGISKLGTTRVYWCASAQDCIPYCSSNTVTIGQGAMNVSGKDYTGTYDGMSHGIEVAVTSPSNAVIYYSTANELTKDNYLEKGNTTNPTRASAGTTIVYWCAVKEGYDVSCSNNKITINPATMLAEGYDYDGFTMDSNPTVFAYVYSPSDLDYKVYYSSSVVLNPSNYTSGSLESPKISSVGTTTVYWCAVADNYETVCSSNNVTLKEMTMAEQIVYMFDTRQINLMTHYDSTITYGPNDNSYRFTGSDASIYNYVCFEGDTCSDNNLYRVIGVFGNQVKLIKYTSATGMFWTNPPANIFNIPNPINYWSGNNLDNYLNNTWLASLGNKANLIANTTWKVGGISQSYQTAKEIYAEEQADTVTVNRKIGLLYISEYGFSIGYEPYLSNYLAEFEKSLPYTWMHHNDAFWTISRATGGNTNAFYINPSGSVFIESVYDDEGEFSTHGVYPTFSLISSVKIKEGKGTKSNPWIIYN